MLSALPFDLRQAFRSVRRQPVFTAVVVGTLAIGIGANTAMFALIHAALLEPLPYKDPERLVMARRTVAGRTLRLNSAPDYYDYLAQASGFEALAASRMGSWKATLIGGGRPERVPTLIVSHDLPATLGIEPVAGRYFSPQEGTAGAPYVAMISERLAQRRFGGSPSALSKALSLNGIGPGPVSATVVGVLPATFRFLDDADVWMPMRRGESDGPETRRFHNWILVGRLKAGVSMAAVQSQLDVISRRLQRQYPETNKEKALRIDPLQTALLQAQTPRLMVLMAAVAVVLLIACANVAGMLLARGVVRRPELALRAAIGASRGRITAQLLTESLLLGLVSGLAGILLGTWLQRLLPIATGLTGAGVTTQLLHRQVLLFALAASLTTAVLCGLAPALRAGSLRPADILAPGSRATESRGGARLRSALVVGQVALSLVLLVGAGLLIRSLAALMATDLAFEPRNLLATSLVLPDADERRRLQLQAGLYEDLAALPGVAAVAFTSHMPILQPWGDPPMWPTDRPPVDSSQEQTAYLRVVLPGYFRTLGIRLLSGRDLLPVDRAGTPRVLVINDVMAREFFPGRSALGEHVTVTGMAGSAAVDCEVVGVVQGARTEGVGREPYATAYVSANQMPLRAINILIRSTLPPQTLARAVHRVVAARDPDVPVDPLVPMEAIVGESLLNQRVLTFTLTAFSAIALLLAALGLYGILAQYVTQRTREIGVRMALGAGRRQVMADVLRRSAVMVLPGLGIGVLASLAGARLIARFLYGVPSTDPATFIGVTMTLALVALTASAWPAWRAVHVDPVRALRAE